MLSLIAAIPLFDLLIILIPCLILFALVWLQQRRARQAGADIQGFSDLESWRDRLAYFGKLLGFALISLVVVSLTLMVYQNNKAANGYRQPAPSQVEAPEDFNYPLEEVEFQSEDGTRLAGWFIEGSQPATVIMLHGYGGSRLSMIWHAEQLAQAGFSVLLYDERGSGESEATRRSYGWEDPMDVLAAVDFIQDRPQQEGDSLGIAGCSIGAQIALQAAAREPRLAAVWADGPALVRAADLPKPYNWVSVIASSSSHIFDWVFAAKLGMFPPPPLIEQLPAVHDRPVQFIAGGMPANALGSEAIQVQNYVDFAGPNANFWVIDQAVHCDGPRVAPEEYSNRMVNFFEANLLH